MDGSSGLVSALKEASVWVIAAMLGVGGVVYSSDISAMLNGGRGGTYNEDAPIQKPASKVARKASSDDGEGASDGENSEVAVNADGEVSEDGEGTRSPRKAVEESDPNGFTVSTKIVAADNGHFITEAEINGSPIEVVVDTGATGVALRYEDAEEIGLTLSDEDFNIKSQTANGTSRVAKVELDEIRIGDVAVKNVEAYVAERGALFGTLLGMSFLNRISRVDMRGRELVLEQ